MNAVKLSFQVTPSTNPPLSSVPQDAASSTQPTTIPDIYIYVDIDNINIFIILSIFTYRLSNLISMSIPLIALKIHVSFSIIC